MGLWKRLAGGRGASTLTRPDVEGERGTRERGAAFERFSRAVDGPMMIVVVVVPMLRPLRVLRGARLLRLLRPGPAGRLRRRGAWPGWSPSPSRASPRSAMSCAGGG